MAKTNPCSNCGSPVPARRTSQSGYHWCRKPECQAQKQAKLRAARRLEGQTGQPYSFQTSLAFFIKAAVHSPRRACDQCGLEDAVNGYAHRTADGSSICQGTGALGSELGAFWIDLIHPERRPSL